MITAIYLRVSSKQQDTKSQEADLAAWETAQVAKGETVRYYRDTASGTNYNRPGWRQLEQDYRCGKVQRIAVWRLDRLGRLAGATISLLDELERLGIAFVSIRDGFDSGTPAGRLMRNLLASFAQYETEVRAERQSAGIAAAKAVGKRWGGRKLGTRVKLTREKQSAIQTMHQAGTSIAEIARNLELSRNTVYAAIRGQQPA